jgi:hypothetical protein
VLVASRGYSGFENKGELQSPHEEDSFVKGTVVTNLDAASILRAKRNRTPFSQYLTERTGEQGAITKGQQPRRQGAAMRTNGM